jgi:phosphoribosylamine-glycine ligase
MNLPIVVKADGLCAGKGVIIAQSKDEAKTAVSDMLSGASFGDAGTSVVVEEYLDGEMDEYPENAFFNAGTIEDVKKKAEQMEQNA